MSAVKRRKQPGAEGSVSAESFKENRSSGGADPDLALLVARTEVETASDLINALYRRMNASYQRINAL